jgi:hypothetical protein
MNMFVSSAAVAAAPAVAMNSAAHEPPAIDHRAILARVEQIVDLLRTRFVCEGWRMDEHGAARALDYFRRHVDGPAFTDEDEDTTAYHQALEFFRSHGQNLDWIHDGNVGGMICGLAGHSTRANEATDAQLLALEEKVFAHKEAFDALKPEADRLREIWCKEDHRLHDEFETTRIWPTFEERKAILDAMPEYKESMRLQEMQQQHREKADDLVKQMWEIKAQTPEGRRAKVLVLLGYVMEDDEWRRAFDQP